MAKNGVGRITSDDERRQIHVTDSYKRGPQSNFGSPKQLKDEAADEHATLITNKMQHHGEWKPSVWAGMYDGTMVR